MYINELVITNYRNYSHYKIEFSTDYNFIIGDNGQGKTNLIEALYILGMAKSFRISTDKDLIKKGEDFFYLKGTYHNEKTNINAVVELGYNGKIKNAKLNGDVQKRLSDWIGNLKTVVMLNQDIELVLGTASVRRKYMDMVISLSDHDYLLALQQYNKALKQRNKFLKEENPHYTIYNPQLIKYGSEIVYKRQTLFDNMNDDANKIFKNINPDIQHFNLKYKPNIIGVKAINENNININDVEMVYDEALNKNRKRAEVNKTTVTGPHRDDFLIQNGKEAFKKFASQGQTRVASLTLKLIAVNHIENSCGERVILLLDDILLDLDAEKKNMFLELVKEHQCFFTSTDINGIGDIYKTRPTNKLFKIDAGNIISDNTLDNI